MSKPRTIETTPLMDVWAALVSERLEAGAAMGDALAPARPILRRFAQMVGARRQKVTVRERAPA